MAIKQVECRGIPESEWLGDLWTLSDEGEQGRGWLRHAVGPEREFKGIVVVRSEEDATKWREYIRSAGSEYEDVWEFWPSKEKPEDLLLTCLMFMERDPENNNLILITFDEADEPQFQVMSMKSYVDLLLRKGIVKQEDYERKLQALKATPPDKPDEEEE